MINTLFSKFIIFLLSLFVPLSVAAQGCLTGASALGNAFVRANPIYALYYGSLESYVANSKEHFVAGGDSIQCAQSLSHALMNKSIQSYDPNALRRKQELNGQLRAMGIAPGPNQPTASQQLYFTALQLNRLARVLPPAANGNYQPLRTPTNQIEQMQMLSAQILTAYLQDPMIKAAFQRIEPKVRELAELEYQIMVNMANSLDQ